MARYAGRMSDMARLILATRLVDLADTWLEARCCHGATFMPLRRLVANHGGGRRVGEVVARLRCHRCGALPAVVALIESPDAWASGRGGAPPGWRIVLAADPLSRAVPTRPAGWRPRLVTPGRAFPGEATAGRPRQP